MELMKFPSRGGLSVRSILTFVFTALLTALLVTISLGPVTQAQNPGSNWKGETIMFDNRQYYPAGTAEAGESHGLPAGTEYYVAIEETNDRPLTRKAHIIYFAPGVSPPEAATGTYVVYNYSSDKEFSNPSGRQTIDMTPKEESGSVGSSCSVSGVGWIICPVSVFLANSMDWLFEQVAQFVAVPPLTVNDTNTPLYTAWNIMRNIANIAFIIAFLIIIYSQLTNFGVTNYGIKKLLPRLIVAAVLVNVSFYACALVVDASNILGYGFQEILIQIRQDTFALTDSSVASGAWSAITAVALSGGAVTAGWIGLSSVAAGSAAASIYLIVPLLIGLILTLLFVLLILAARQAIIIILIVVSPLAFVANLLPNTEKWFEKWKDLFMTMMIFFPAFSLVFGGSQLAGGIIIQNASNLVMMIFGLAVQVAPLVITPLLLKLSGGLLGRIAGIVNNPRKGLMDRTKNWSGDRAQMHRNKSLAVNRKDGDKKTQARRKANLLRRTAQRMDASSRNTKKASDMYANQAETLYMGENKRFAELADQEHEAHQDREIVDNKHKLRAQDHINHRGSRAHLKNAQVEAGKRAVESAVQITNADISEYMANRPPINASVDLTKAAAELNAHRQTLAIEKQRAANAESIQQDDFAKAMINDGLLRVRAGGIDPQGADSALASSINTVRAAYGQSVTEARQIIKHFNLSSGQRQELALLSGDKTVTVTRDDGTSHTFTANDVYAREAAIEDQVAVGTIDQVEAIVQASGVTRDSNGKVTGGALLADYRTTIAEALAKNGLGGKSLYLGGKTIDDVGLGRINGPDDLMGVVIENIAKGKVSEKDLANIDPIAVERIFQAAERIKSGSIPSLVDLEKFPIELLKSRMEELSVVAQDTLINDERVNIKPKSKEFIERLAKITDPGFVEPPLPRVPDEPDNGSDNT